jgi:hypothetical protein
MGTSLQVIDATHGHLARDADEHDREAATTPPPLLGHVVDIDFAPDGGRGGAAA